MEIELKIDAEAVQQKLVQSLIDSGIGKQIEKAIKEMLTKEFGDWGNRRTLIESAVQGCLDHELRTLVRETLESKRDELRALINQKLTAEIIDKLASAAIDKL